MHLGIAGKATDRQRLRPLAVQHVEHVLRAPGQFEDHAGGAAHVEPAIVTGLDRDPLVLMIREDGAQNIER